MNKAQPAESQHGQKPPAGPTASGSHPPPSSRPETPSRQRPRLWPIWVIFLIQGLFLALVYALAALHSPPGRVVPLDAIALPGSDVVLGARLERETPPVVGARLSGIKFLFEAASGANAAGGNLAGSAVTDSRGTAAFTFRAPPTPGLFHYRVRLEDPKSVPLEKAEEELLLDVIPAESRLLVVMPQTLTSEPNPLKGDGEKAQPEFAAALRDLSKAHGVLYLATQNAYSPARLRPWLESQGLPQGPVFLTLPAGDWPKLSSFVSSLGLSRWPGQHWGICSDRAEAMALERAGLRVVVLEASSAGGSVGKIFSAPSWVEAKKIIEGKP